jgi:AcrR family transcriptional regulator
MDTRERLIESTQELLWERGYVGTSPNAILRRAAVGQGSMYHHFTGKPGLALAALTRTTGETRARAELQFLGPLPVMERITRHLLSQRDVLRGCRVGRLTYDPEIFVDPVLKQPIREVFEWHTGELARLLREGQDSGELSESLDPEDIAATIAAVLQGAYVLARASDAVAPFYRAINGVLALLQGFTRDGAR